jgi:polyisoprenyl-teichoic acid--peptidoglycan teichoic acid transferase
VEEFLGVPIHFYAQIDFYAFEQFINELDGVTIDVPYEIRVDPLGPGNTVILEPGEQVLDGPLALAYARARYTDGGDFDRAQRQQQVIMALRSRILRVDRLPIVISRAPRIYQELASGINTNMDLDQAIQLAWLAQQIPLENIQRGVISPPDQVILAKSPDGDAWMS